MVAPGWHSPVPPGQAGARLGAMAELDPKATLLRYLQFGRDALAWKLDGLGEYDIRRPMTPTGTNLLGLIKHQAGVEVGYFGDTFGRPLSEPLPWESEVAGNPNVDMWATATESREYIVGLYRRAWAHADATISALPLEATGHVPWWPAGRDEVTLHQILVHVATETHRHAGHADIIRETIDGAAGLRKNDSNLPEADPASWSSYRQQVERAAREAAAARPS
ncbi:MAG: DinB family protein [Streptosporangiaceae bacterium]